MNPTKKINEEGLKILKTWEGCKLVAYKDIGGILTIGYGHTGDNVYEGQMITQDQAETLLNQDLETAEKGIESCVTVPLTDNQFSALVSLVYNIGLHAFKACGTLRALNSGDYFAAANRIPLWDKVNGNEVEGLKQRRLSERNLFLKGN